MPMASSPVVRQPNEATALRLLGSSEFDEHVPVAKFELSISQIARCDFSDFIVSHCNVELVGRCHKSDRRGRSLMAEFSGHIHDIPFVRLDES